MANLVARLFAIKLRPCPPTSTSHSPNQNKGGPSQRCCPPPVGQLLAVAPAEGGADAVAAAAAGSASVRMRFGRGIGRSGGQRCLGGGVFGGCGVMCLLAVACMRRDLGCSGWGEGCCCAGCWNTCKSNAFAASFAAATVALGGMTFGSDFGFGGGTTLGTK
eukprot:15479362-Alexandrium_andersonii.AAC.1